MIWLRSIKGRLFAWSFSFIVTLLLSLGVFLYHEVEQILLESVDQSLHSKEQLITGLLHEENNNIEIELSEIMLGEYSLPRSGHYYKVLMNGLLLAASPSMVEGDFDLASGNIASSDAEKNEKIYMAIGPDREPIRTLHHSFSTYGQSFDIFVAESIREYVEMIHTYRNILMIVILASILIVCLMNRWIIIRSLLPLDIFTASISRITHRSLDNRLVVRTEVQELDGLAESFNDMLDRLQSAFESERRLVSDASHELKTPVSVIKAHCDVLLLKDRSKEEYREALVTIQDVSANMGRLINDLLSLARLDAGALSASTLRDVSLKVCVDNALRLVQPLAEQRTVSVNVSSLKDIVLQGDGERLTEALLNLIENAVRYNKENGVVDVSYMQKNGTVHVMVSDTGIGIAEEDRNRIFDRFYRSDAVRNSDGTGLGLNIVKLIVEGHHGTIMVDSIVGEGSRFTITLPLSVS
ncbi:hypothetical protein JWJ90_15555 [Desulfobulbus rhabdoformis]|jgi:heavy metal sensor kinase|uniref:sensor histidine kinase n=1 Tax=Desulfobulbus rhabdoformis TaxID=34032 RepID=UPI0019631226|nr:ATP-binding protein [Desulfobulbus rhabdoformis]MBM9615684.1 hypothetical protein [Desulfobulbus rhabdoformis]